MVQDRLNPATKTARFEIDEAKLKQDACYDGTWVLQTSFGAGLDAQTVALTYEHLWMMEHLFRTIKSILETRPISHKRDETIRGHVFCSFLAILLKCELERRLISMGVAGKRGRSCARLISVIYTYDTFADHSHSNERVHISVRVVFRRWRAGFRSGFLDLQPVDATIRGDGSRAG
jgi:hypothetical protein